MQSSWTAASMKNIRTQRQLELELLDIEKRWHMELKHLNRKRLGVIFDLNRYKNHLISAEHVSDNLRGQELRLYTRTCQDRMLEQRLSHRRSRKFDFTVDLVERVKLRLPAIDVDPNPNKHSLKESVTSADLNLKRASFQRGAEELNLFLHRSVRRSTRRQSEIEEDLEEIREKEHEESGDHDVDTARSGTNSVHQGEDVTSRLHLPSISET